MADIENLGMTESGDGSVAATPEDEQRVERQQSLVRWQWLIAFGPLLLVVITTQMPIANALLHKMTLPLILVPVFWAVAFKGYLSALTIRSN